MKEIGEWLRRERTARMVSLESIRDETKITMRYLQALEEGEFDKLPGEPYVKGFIRLYTRAVGCDAEPILERYRELQEKQARQEPAKRSPSRGRAFVTKLSETLQWLGF